MRKLNLKAAGMTAGIFAAVGGVALLVIVSGTRMELVIAGVLVAVGIGLAIFSCFMACREYLKQRGTTCPK